MIKRHIVTLLIAAFTLVLFGATVSAQAASDCTTKVIDTTNKSVLDKSATNAAINKLESTGADVYVRSFEKTPSGSIDTYYRETVKSCSNWQSPDGKTPKANLIFVGFGMDKTSAIFYGSNWHILDTKIDAIRANSLNAGLKSGNFTNGITGSLAALETAIKTPASSPSSTGAPFDFAGAGLVLLYIVLAIVALTLLFFTGRHVYRVAARNRARQEEFDTAKTAAVSYQAKAESAYAQLMLMPEVDREKAWQELELKSLLLPAAKSKAFEQQLDGIQTQINEAIAAYNTHKATAAVTGAYESAESCRTLAAKFKADMQAFQNASHDLATLWKEVDELNQNLTPDGQAKRLEKIRAELGTTQSVLTSISAYSTSEYDKQRESFARQIDALLSPSRPLAPWDAHTSIEKLADNVASLTTSLDDLKLQQQKIRNASEELTTMLKSTRKLVANSGLSDRLVTKYEKQLDSLERSIGEFTEDPSKNADKLLRQRDNLYASMENVADACRSEKRKVAERSRSRSTARSSSSRSRSASNNDNGFTGGFLGGYIGSSSGSSHSSSHDYGGGSSGGWDSGSSGGGFDSGGGSSGGW